MIDFKGIINNLNDKYSDVLVSRKKQAFISSLVSIKPNITTENTTEDTNKGWGKTNG